MVVYNEPLPKGSVRLLRLLPYSDEDPEIRCQLFTCALLDSESTHPYEALSYVWGPENSQHHIYINNYEVLVRENLHAALSHLRDRFMERIIWIDAICINQEDNNEKGHQVQAMAKIYSKASRVIVWLGEAAADSDQALKVIQEAAEEEYANVEIKKPNSGDEDSANDDSASDDSASDERDSEIDDASQQAMVSLLKRPWFQRIWVLQEVAAARQILVRCGLMELDGYAFCSGLNALKLSFDTYPELQSLLRSTIYLIRGAGFRPRYQASRAGRFSLNIRPLSELVDMYHNRKATELCDKVYALLGMSSDDPIAAGLSANYDVSWKEVFQRLVTFSLSDQVSVDTWDEKEVAVVRGNGHILGKVSSVEASLAMNDRQSVVITWENAFHRSYMTGRQSHRLTFQASAQPIQAGDLVCLVQGASKPTIIRPFNDYSAIIMITVPLPNSLPSIPTFPNDLLLVWDWDVPRYEQDYQYFLSSSRGSMRPKTVCQNDLDEAIRLWNMGLLLNAAEYYDDAGKRLQRAVKVYGTAFKSVDNPDHGPWSEANKEVLRLMEDFLIEAIDIETVYASYGQAPLSWAAANGHEAFLQHLLDKGANVEVKDPCKSSKRLNRCSLGQSRNIKPEEVKGMTPLLWAAAKGHKVVVQQLLDRGADADSKDILYRTPLFWAAIRGHVAVVEQLLDRGAKIEMTDDQEMTPLGWAAEAGHEAVIRLLLDRGADIDLARSYDTPLVRAAEKGHEAAVRLLLDRGAKIGSWHSPHSFLTPLFHAAEAGHEAVVRLLLDRGADINPNQELTPLSYAAKRGHKAVVQLLLDRGADIDHRDSLSDQTPLIYAARKGHEAVVQLLLDRGADIEVRDSNGSTPLIHAVHSGHRAVVQLLLERGADIEVQNSYGSRPLGHAKEEALKQLLESHLARLRTDHHRP